jgi:hypothetical protein
MLRAAILTGAALTLQRADKQSDSNVDGHSFTTYNPSNNRLSVYEARRNYAGNNMRFTADPLWDETVRSAV